MDWLSLTLQYVLAPLLLGIGGIIGWFVKSKSEALQAAQAALRENKLKTYEEILEPFVAVLNSNDAHAEARAIKKLGSPEYRRTTLRITLFGSDSVVNAWNKLMQHFFLSSATDDPNSGFKAIGLYADFLVEIRKDLRGDTNLTRLDMLAGQIKDLETTKDRING